LKDKFTSSTLQTMENTTLCKYPSIMTRLYNALNFWTLITKDPCFIPICKLNISCPSFKFWLCECEPPMQFGLEVILNQHPHRI
jgi:hypothetical protein